MMCKEQDRRMALQVKNTGFRLALPLLLFVPGALVFSQSTSGQHPGQMPGTFKTESDLVLVSALVTNPDGELVYSLGPDQFAVTDNGVEQKVQVDDDPSHLPLALVVVVETGGSSVRVLPILSHLQTMLEEIVGDRPREIALVTFDSQPRLAHGFTPNVDDIGAEVEDLHFGDRGAAVLDALQLSMKLLQSRPSGFRRVLLMISETFDQGSQAKPDDVYQALRSTNTPVYSIAFSTTKEQVAAALSGPSPGQTRKARCLQNNPGAPPGTCRGYGALGRLLMLASRLGDDDSASPSNVPEVAATLTGGRYLPFDAGHDRKSLEAALFAIANDLPNRYLVSFRPASPAPGLHNLRIEIRDHAELHVAARTSYWVPPEAASGAHP
jgi:VWFA-related protein